MDFFASILWFYFVRGTNQRNIPCSWIGGVSAVNITGRRHWCICSNGPLMNLILGSDESSHSSRLLAIYLPYTRCLDCTSLPLDEWMSLSLLSPLKPTMSAVGLRHLLIWRQNNNNNTADVRDGKTSEGCRISTAREAFKRLRWKEVLEEGSHTSFHIPPSLCSVILPCSVVAALIASRFSKGRSISGGSVPRLRLIPFWTFVGAEELIEKHLIAITCRQWMNDEWSYSIVARHWSTHTQYRWM